MELFLQFGYGMMGLSRDLLKSWGGGTVVLSPRDLERHQLERLASDLRNIKGGRVLLDPQFYFPRSDHHRLTGHGYWPESYQTDGFFTGEGVHNMLRDLLELNRALGTYAFILPGLMANVVDDDWCATVMAAVEGARSLDTGMPIYATVALGSDAVRDTDGIQDVLEEFRSAEVDGVYVLAEHPNGSYLVEDPIWLANLIELCAGLKVFGKQVIVGYANQQLLCLGASSVDAICAGTWMNVRAFSPDRFQAAQDEEVRRRTTWYYCPTALSEYKLPFLDVAHRQGVLDLMKPPERFGSTYADALFSGPQPSSVQFGEPEAFRHYLHCLRHQVREARQSTFESTVGHHRKVVEEAENLIQTLEDNGVYSQGRGFGDIVDVVRSALKMHERARGPLLRRLWSRL